MLCHFIVSILTIVFINIANSANIEQRDAANQNPEVEMILTEIKPQFDINRIRELSLIIEGENYAKKRELLENVSKEDKVDFIFKAVKYHDYEVRYKKIATIEELNNGHDFLPDTLGGLKFIK